MKMEDPVLINRREAIARLMAITGTVVIGSELFLTGCRAPEAAKRTAPFTAAEIALLDEIGETIIPTTDTPGAKAAAIGRFIAATATDCYDDASFASLRGGLTKIDTASRKKHGKTFMESTPAERTALANELEVEQRKYAKEKARTEPQHYFRLMKELTLIGYFTSEIGATKALRYVESPGSYDGNLPYKKGDRAFYNPSRRIGLG
ncbi:MAG: gluconate 2-dehydrogenase subunit 3 family protein [Gemmatimonadaceae bacterium]